MIRPAKLGEIPQIMGLTKACTRHMNEQGILQWNEDYPSEDAFSRDVGRTELLVMENGGSIIGCIAVSTLMDEEYKSVRWLTPNGRNMYVHRLAVHPDHQGKGYARQLMDKAENMARSARFISVRLDTFSKNVRNQRFYEARGYQKLEPIYFPKQSQHPFYCYELVL
jgi:ribosomal protein S18 acetylase RimI-like enzyme